MAEGTSSLASSLAQRVYQLLQNRAERQPLDARYMRCPLNSAHQVPIAAIVTHLMMTHQKDSLDIAPDAMYGLNTRTRRSEFLNAQFRRMRHVTESDGNESECCIRRRKRCRRSPKESPSSGTSSWSSRHSRSESGGSQSSNSSQSSTRPHYHEEQLRSERLKEEQPQMYSYGGHDAAGQHKSPNIIPKLIGQYPFGASINKQRLEGFLLSFGRLRSLEFLPNGGEFLAEFEDPAAASKCLEAATPQLTIDDVGVRMHPMSFPEYSRKQENFSSGGEAMRSSAVQSTEGAKVPLLAAVPAVPQIHPQCAADGMPSVVVGVKAVNASVLRDAGNFADAFTSVNSAWVSPNAAVFACALKTTSERTPTVEEIWKELWLFGEVKDILLVGSRVVVEYSDSGGVRRAKRAMTEDPGAFKFCSLFGVG